MKDVTGARCHTQCCDIVFNILLKQFMTNTRIKTIKHKVNHTGYGNPVQCNMHLRLEGLQNPRKESTMNKIKYNRTYMNLPYSRPLATYSSQCIQLSTSP